MEKAILYHGKKCTCPNCSGLMTGGQAFKVCRDCGSRFKATGLGVADNEVVFKEVKQVKK